jgi:hypothetical protein
MPQPKIIKSDIIVVASAKLNDYGDLIVTDMSGNQIKISKKREHLHELFQEGMAVELYYASYMDKLYVADAKLVSEQLPEDIAEEPNTKVSTPASTSLNPKKAAVKDIISMHTMCLSYAKDQIIVGLQTGQLEFTKVRVTTTALADSYLDWLKAHVEKYLDGE